MQRFFHSKRFKVLLGILAALIVGIIIAAASHGGASPSSSLLGAVFSPLQRLSAYVSEQIGNFSGSFVSAGTYAKEIDELKQQIADYQKKLVDYDEMKRQITSYESVLGVKEAHQDWEMAPASIIARDSADLFYSFTLNKGSSDGIEPNDPVISGQYLVGRVERVWSTGCTVKTILDPSVNVSAEESNTNEQGVLGTDIALSREGKCQLSGLERSTVVSKGGIVQTSGAGEFFPKGILIGTVEDVKNNTYDISAYAIVKPGVEISAVHDVFIITAFEGQKRRRMHKVLPAAARHNGGSAHGNPCRKAGPSMVKKEKKQVYLRWGILAVIILLVSLLQNTGGLLPRIYGVSAMPLIPLVVCIAMLEREMAGACFGMFAGMLWDAVGTRGDGFHAVVLLIIGCVCGLLLHYLMRVNFVTALLLSACAALVHNLLYWLVFLVIPGYDGAVSALVRFYLPASLYAVLFLPLFFFPLRALGRKLKNPLSTNEEPSVIL